MAYAMMRNAAGNFVAPSAEAFAAAASTADWTSVQDFNLVITNAPGEQAWPITATNFILMYEQPADAQRSAAAREFFTWALENGGQQAADLDYVPLPPERSEEHTSELQSLMRISYAVLCLKKKNKKTKKQHPYPNNNS